jgi:hypothetical protein
MTGLINAAWFHFCLVIRLGHRPAEFVFLSGTSKTSLQRQFVVVGLCSSCSSHPGKIPVCPLVNSVFRITAPDSLKAAQRSKSQFWSGPASVFFRGKALIANPKAALRTRD